MALAEHHIETIFKLFKYEIAQEYRTIILRGSDQVNIQANNLWMFSSLIRALIGSSVSANEELIMILLPDHHGHDISTALNVLNTSQMDDIVFSENVKDILCDLGVNFNNIKQIQIDEETNLRESKGVIRNNLIDELINNKPVEEVVCYYCSKSFTGQRAKDKYRSHLGQTHFLSEMKEETAKYFDPNHKCTACGKTYVTASFKRKHLTKHHSYLVDKILRLVNRKENESLLEQDVTEVQNLGDTFTEAVKPVEHSLENFFTELLNNDTPATNVSENEEDPEIHRVDDENQQRTSSSPEAQSNDDKLLMSSGETEILEEADDENDNESNGELFRNRIESEVNPQVDEMDSNIKDIDQDEEQNDTALHADNISEDEDSHEGQTNEENEDAELQNQLMLSNNDLSDSDGEDEDDATKDNEKSNQETDDIQKNLLLDQDLDSSSDSDDEESTDKTPFNRSNDSNEDLGNSSLNESSLSNIAFECKLCPKKYDRKGSLSSHYNRNHRKSNNTKKGDTRDLEIDAKVDKMIISLNGGFKCFLCGRKYARRHHVASHCESHLSYSHKCPQCSEKFKTRSALKNHLGQKHK